jgi:hypothetical protein
MTAENPQFTLKEKEVGLYILYILSILSMSFYLTRGIRTAL